MMKTNVGDLDGTTSQEKDINDVFDELLMSEEKLIKEGYSEGFEKGVAEENTEGYHLGYHRGAELGAELGYYLGIVETHLDYYTANAELATEKITKQLELLQNLIVNFPQTNDERVDILSLLDDIRAHYKKLCALLKKIQQQLDGIINFLELHHSLATNAMVNYFSKTLYDTCLNPQIRDEITKLGADETVDYIFENHVNSNMPHLYSFIQNTKKLSLNGSPQICLNSEEFENKLMSFGSENIPSFKMERFMNSKKSHEVEILSSVAASVHRLSNTTHLVDIGDGKGYLSSFLALHHQIPVLGVDASYINTNSANKRLTKLRKMWNNLNLPTKVRDESFEKNSHNDLYKQTTVFVDECVDFSKFISSVFSYDDKPSIGLIGLHTCGDLAPTSIKIFDSNTDIKTLCNVACCYHLISESFEISDELDRNIVGYPMSDYLSSKKYCLGKDIRMLAAQSLDRILHERKAINNSLFYRAIFQVFLKDRCVNTDKNVGKLRKQCKSFVEYSRKAISKMELDVNVSDSELSDLFDVYKNKFVEMNVYYLLRCHLAPVIESFILLDRLLYLRERGYENSYLVQLFDPVISPRCYGLIVLKNTDTNSKTLVQK